MTVVIAVISDQNRGILLSKRLDHVHQGGLWEFPGGKVEPNEEPFHAISRELQEELGITVTQATHWFDFEHVYDQLSIQFSCWKVSAYTGTPSGLEGQPIRWVPINELKNLDFPEANHCIIEALENRINCGNIE